MQVLLEVPVTIVVAPGPQVVIVAQIVDVTVLKVVAPDGMKTLKVAEQLGTAEPEHEDPGAVVVIAVEVGEPEVGDGDLVRSGSSESFGSGDGGSEGGVGGGKPPPPPPPPPPPGHRSGIKQPGSQSGPTQAHATVGIGITAPPPLWVDE